jgi:delta 1-pyrroline-5-carboxylate dehydrogenase
VRAELPESIVNPATGKPVVAVPEASAAQVDAAVAAARSAFKTWGQTTPQERSLYQRHLTNLTGPGGVDNPDGSRSTLFQATVDHDGKTYAIDGGNFGTAHGSTSLAGAWSRLDYNLFSPGSVGLK